MEIVINGHNYIDGEIVKMRIEKNGSEDSDDDWWR